MLDARSVQVHSNDKHFSKNFPRQSRASAEDKHILSIDIRLSKEIIEKIKKNETANTEENKIKHLPLLTKFDSS